MRLQACEQASGADVFGIGGWEFVVIGIVALVVLGPDRLPRYAADAARFVRQIRRMAASAQEEVRRELGPEFQDISISDLNPRAFVRKHLLDDTGLEDLGRDLSLEDPGPRRSRSPAQPPAQPSTQSDDRPPYDADAT
jgi:sec-independent protein translocase protein TatB